MISYKAASKVLRTDAEHQVCKATKERSMLAKDSPVQTSTTSEKISSSDFNPRTFGTATQVETQKNVIQFPPTTETKGTMGDKDNNFLSMTVDDVRRCELSNKTVEHVKKVTMAQYQAEIVLNKGINHLDSAPTKVTPHTGKITCTHKNGPGGKLRQKKHKLRHPAHRRRNPFMSTGNSFISLEQQERQMTRKMYPP